MGNAASVKQPIISIVGLSNSGKTTLLEKLVRVFAARGLRVGTIKHSCHSHPFDTPGKDSWRHKNAGAERTLFAGPSLLQMISDVKGTASPASLAREYLAGLDLVLVEGFIQSDTDKIEIVRSQRSKEPVLIPEEGLVAVVTDRPVLPLTLEGIPRFGLDDVEKIADFIESHLSLGTFTMET